MNHAYGWRPRTGSPTLAVYLPQLRMGGGELSMLRLAAGFARGGMQVELIVHTLADAEIEVPEDVDVIELGSHGTLASLRPLVQVLCARRPRWLLSAFPHSNVAAVTAVAWARIDCACIVSEHAPLSQQIERQGGWRFRMLPPLLRWAYRRADGVVAVSRGVRDDLVAMLGPGLRLHTIANPVLETHGTGGTPVQPHTPLHSWLADDGLQVILSVSRLSVEKDIPTLLRAFALLQPHRPWLRLLVAGDGPARPELEALIDELGLAAVAALPGRVTHPRAWMRRAAVFALASHYEGFGNVLVEALASGTPVVSTDCPVGPREILAAGRFGELVPVGDEQAMAAALARALQRPDPPAGAVAFASGFTDAAACAAYRRLFASVAAAC